MILDNDPEMEVHDGLYGLLQGHPLQRASLNIHQGHVADCLMTLEVLRAMLLTHHKCRMLRANRARLQGEPLASYHSDPPRASGLTSG